MIRFMVCDTDTAFAGRLGGILHQCFDPCSVEYLYGPSALEASLQADPGGADILITEIDLREKNAIDIVARSMRDSSPLQVIYMTTRIDYCTEVYKTRHSGFLVKPLRIDTLRQSIQWALEMLKARRDMGIVLQRNSQIYVISPQSFLYAESSGRMVVVVTDAERLEIYGKLTDLTTQLDRRFIQCHKSYLVNMERVRRYIGDRFLLENGIVIPISQSKRKTVRETFLSYTRAAPLRESVGI